MKISFIVPSWHHLANPFLHQPYWELYHSTILKKNFKDEKNFELIVTDLRSKKDFKDGDIKEADIFFYWIFKTADAIECYNHVKNLKKQYPKSLHVAGGTHVETMHEECVNKFDSIILGPGEPSFTNFIKDFKKKETKKIYKESWREHQFNNYPYADRSFIDESKIVNRDLFSQYGNLLSTMTYFSRGCMFNCAFCTLNIPRGLQIRSGKNISSEIKYLKEKYKIEGLLLKDEVAIHPNKKISQEILDAISEHDIVWRGQTTTHATLDQLKHAKDSGCVELAVGIETVDNNVMKLINKDWQSEKQIKTFLENTKKLGIKTKGCLIFGLPGEKEDILEKTINFIKENEIDFANVSGLCPLPGSTIFEKAEEYGVKFVDKDWGKHGHLIYRFGDEDDIGLPFEYSKDTPWGKSLPRETTLNNIKRMQEWLTSNNKSY